MVPQELPNPDNVPAPCHPVPHKRQILWNETEFYAFFHYGMNTFTGREWGNGDEDEKIYAPLAMPNPEQWITSVKAAGMNGGIAVVNTIPAEYMRGAQVSIVGDMQQVQHYTIQVVGAPKGQGGADFLGKTYGDKAVIDASQYFTADEVKAVSIEGYES